MQASSYIVLARTPAGAAPHWDSNDVYFLDGQQLVSCTTLGGTTARNVQKLSPHPVELREQRVVRLGEGRHQGHVRGELPGERTERASLGALVRVDKYGNRVDYTYFWDQASLYNESYIDTISYNGTVIKFYSQFRTGSEGLLSYAIGTTNPLDGAEESSAIGCRPST